MAKAKKSAADVAADLKNTVAQDSTPEVCQTPAKQHAVKATWKGYLSAFGVVMIPVATYKATDTDTIERHMYHGFVPVEGEPDKMFECCGSLKQGAMSCTACGAEVSKSNAAKGVKVGDKIVYITDAEMKSAQPTSDKILQITEFVPADAVDVTYYESSEYLAADKTGEKAFATFQQGLYETGRVAIGTFVSRGHQYTVAIRPKGQHGLVMSYLFAEYEVRDCGKWNAVETNPAEVELVKQLMTETELAKDAFTPAPYDPCFAAVRKLIAAKIAGETPSTPTQEAEPKAAVDDLLAKLQASVKNAKPKVKSAAAGK